MAAVLPHLAVVLPCYNEQEVLPSTLERLLAILGGMRADGLIDADSRLLLVDDGSRDETWRVITEHAAAHREVTGISLSANRGHQNALLAGIDAAVDSLNADVIVSIDADLQDDPSTIVEMVRLYRDEQCDIVLGVRRSRKSDSRFKRTTAQAFYRLMKRLGVNIVYNHADYRLISRRVALALEDYRERNLFLRGIISQMGFKQAQVYYDRTERTAGESKYPLGKMINFAIDGITSFSVKPVRMVFQLGAAFLIISLFLLAYVLYAYFTGKAVSGWSSLMLSLWFVGGCMLISLGIIGEYIAKIYIETKQRPRYHIDRTVNL